MFWADQTVRHEKLPVDFSRYFSISFDYQLNIRSDDSAEMGRCRDSLHLKSVMKESKNVLVTEYSKMYKYNYCITKC